MASLKPEQQPFARDQDNGLPLLDVVKKYRPTILLGVSAVGGLFTEDIVREMAIHVDRPIIFPLSNPTTKAECTAEQAFEWTNGRCVFASGSPFDPVHMDDGRVFSVSQCNNMYVFPGIGLGVTICGARKVTDRMLYVAAKGSYLVFFRNKVLSSLSTHCSLFLVVYHSALAEYLSPDEAANGQVFPHISKIRSVSHTIAVAVIEEAIRTGLNTKVSAENAKNLPAYVDRKMYYPEYVPLIEKRTISI